RPLAISPAQPPIIPINPDQPSLPGDVPKPEFGTPPGRLFAFLTKYFALSADFATMGGRICKKSGNFD
ncbi:MAG: hypothetical protein PUE10_03340, partial [Bacteroidales bacterium]|nr:hypothetical protein [Bacteroidales bacterium]